MIAVVAMSRGAVEIGDRLRGLPSLGGSIGRIAGRIAAGEFPAGLTDHTVSPGIIALRKRRRLLILRRIGRGAPSLQMLPDHLIERIVLVDRRVIDLGLILGGAEQLVEEGDELIARHRLAATFMV